MSSPYSHPTQSPYNLSDQEQHSDYEFQNSQIPSAIPKSMNPQQAYPNSPHSRSKMQMCQQYQLNQVAVVGAAGFGNLSVEFGYDLTFKKQMLGLGQFNQQQMFANNLFHNQDSNAHQNNHNHKEIRNSLNKTKQKYKKDIKDGRIDISPNSIDKDQEQVINIIRNSRNIKQLYQNLTINSNIPKPLNQNFLIQISNKITHQPSTTHKLQCLSTMLSLKTLRKKRRSVRLNIQILKNQLQQDEKSLTQADRKRLQLLGMLDVQLAKKIFVMGLKWSQVGNQGEWDTHQQHQVNQNLGIHKSMRPQATIFTNPLLNNSISPQPSRKDLQKTSQTPGYTTSVPYLTEDPNIQEEVDMHDNSQQYNSAYYEERRIIIFNQILGALISKSVYWGFRMMRSAQGFGARQFGQSQSKRSDRNIDKYRYKQQITHQKYQLDQLSQTPNNYNFAHNENMIDLSQEHSRTNNLENQDQYTEEHQERSIQNTDRDQIHEENPIEAITDYMNELRKQIVDVPRSNRQLIKNYFLKWKIYFLGHIVVKIEESQQQRQQNNVYNGYQNQQQVEAMAKIPQKSQKNRKEIPQKQQTDQNQYKSNKSIQTDLKQQKFQLKQYLIKNKICLFFSSLRELKASKQIKLVTDDYYRKNLMKSAFGALYENKINSLGKKQLQKYSQYIAANQCQQQNNTAKYFYLTNVKYKIFFSLRDILRCSKFVKKLQKAVLGFVFNQIKYLTNQQLLNEAKLIKYQEKKSKRTLFKTFNIIRNQTSFAQRINRKVESFRNKKRLEILDICFSVLSLQWKKQLSIQKRIGNIICISSIKGFFEKLRLKQNFKSQQQILQQKGRYIMQNYRKQNFFKIFRSRYMQSLKNRRTQVLETKLRIQLIKKYTKKSVQQWKKKYNCNRNYRMIENKLRKLKQFEERGKLFKIWYERLIQKYRQKKKDKLGTTNKHKIWLNKYYQKLCAFQQEQSY